MHTFVVHVEDQPSVLNRVVSLFRRRAYNIHDITSSRTHEPGVHRMTIWVDQAIDAEQIVANLYKLVPVLSVTDVTDQPTLDRGLVLVKLTPLESQRAALRGILETFRATIVDETSTTLVAEVSGDRGAVQQFIDAVRPFGIDEMVQTGAIAMTRPSTSTPEIPS